MSKSDVGFIRGRIKSIKYAVRGMWLLITTEHSIMVQLFIAVVVCALGFIFNISMVEWFVQLLAIGLVMAMEGLNTAIEKIADVVQPEFDHRVGFVKDIAAGAVAFAAIIALIIGLLIYLPKFM